MKKNLVNISLSAGVLAAALLVGACETTTSTNTVTTGSPVPSGTVVVVSSPVATPEAPKVDAKASMATITTELGKAATEAKAKNMAGATAAVGAAGAEAMRLAGTSEAAKTALAPLTAAIDKAKAAKDAAGMSGAVATASAAASKIDVSKWPSASGVMGAISGAAGAVGGAASAVGGAAKDAVKEGATKAADATKNAANKAADAMKSKATPTPTPKKP